MKILKFGGTSMASAECILQVAEIVRDTLATGPAAVVVSAMSGITDELIHCGNAAASGEDTHERVETIRRRHRAAADTLLGGEEIAFVAAHLDATMEELGRLLQGASLVGECSPRTRDRILSCGERLSARLLAAALRSRGTPAEFCDARELIATDEAFGNAAVDMETTGARIRGHFAGGGACQIVTGFIATGPSGATTTLGRGGSDYSASILGAALDADCIEIWTDVDGVMSADPRLVPGAFSLPTLSYAELMELSHFGAKVVYPPTLRPARENEIPIVIRNTFNPGFSGTTVVERMTSNGQRVRGISSVDAVALLRLEGDGMVGVPGIASRLFGVLARRGISVILISQASSEHSICFAVEPGAVDEAQRAVDGEFELERGAGLVEPLVVERDFSIIAVVGETMCRIPGIAGRVFSALGERGVNIRAIAQGSSELNISFVVSRDDHADAVLTVHDAFFTAAPEAVGTEA
ncbi:MAG: aspartate kinase [Candidatus Sulfomarinibacteraceae bacterium]